jgi:hypothetical protein
VYSRAVIVPAYVRGLLGVLEHLPGVALARGLFGAIERDLLQTLKKRLEQIDGPPRAAPARARPAAPARTPGALLSELLARSTDQTFEESQRSYFLRILEDIVPDEARILSALSDGTRYPLIDVGHGTRLGGTTERVLRNASSVGKAAGVTWPGAVPRYLSHLRELGLVETEPEDSALGEKYEIVETESAVREAIARVRAMGRAPRVLRRTLRISELGRALWAACEASENGGAASRKT